MPNETEEKKIPENKEADINGRNRDKNYRLGWVRDLPDYRDKMYGASLREIEELASPPAQLDLRFLCPPVYDQGNLGSCTANAIAAAVEFDLMKQGLPDWTPSRLFIYYNERDMEGTVNSDSGAQIRDGIKTLNQQGVAPETSWPYDVSQFAVKPPDSVFAEALNRTASSYSRLNNTDLAELKACITGGFPFVFGIVVYDSFMDADNGNIPMPASYESVQGGHAILAVGYDDTFDEGEAQGAFIFRNSWGSDWGDNGYGHIPYQYLTNPNLSSDFWTIRTIGHIS